MITSSSSLNTVLKITVTRSDFAPTYLQKRNTTLIRSFTRQQSAGFGSYIYVIYRPRGPDREILARGHFHDRGQVSPYPDRARPVNNVFIFLCAILNQIHTKFQCCELDLRSVVFVTLLQRCQVRDFIPRSRDFFKQMGIFWDFFFKNQSRDFFGIFENPMFKLRNQFYMISTRYVICILCSFREVTESVTE